MSPSSSKGRNTGSERAALSEEHTRAAGRTCCLSHPVPRIWDLGSAPGLSPTARAPPALRGLKCWHHTQQRFGVGRGFYLCPKFSSELNIASTNPLHAQHSRPPMPCFILITAPTSELQSTPTNLPFCGQTQEMHRFSGP